MYVSKIVVLIQERIFDTVYPSRERKLQILTASMREGRGKNFSYF